MSMNCKHLLHSCMSTGRTAERARMWIHFGLIGMGWTQPLQRDCATPAAGAHDTMPLKTMCSTTDLFVGLTHTKPRSCMLIVDPKHEEKMRLVYV